MNNFLFTVLILALLYYFLIYLPSQKQLPNFPERISELVKDIELKNQEIDNHLSA